MLRAAVKTPASLAGLDIELTVSPGELVVLVGPNGAGKTSLLRALAGLLPLSDGKIELDGEVLEEVATRRRLPPHERPIGFVFQDYVLFPHLTVLDNVAFGLRSQGAARGRADRQALEWLERLSLSGHAHAKPSELSGGQAQKVALARALAVSPRLLLLDEPLSALDATTRPEVRRDLKRHLSSFEGIRLLVTHDPLEAALLGDRLIVLEEGRVVQSGTIGDLRSRPRSRYVADLAGLNLFQGRASGARVRLDSGEELVLARPAEGDVFVAAYPRSVALYRQRPEGSPRNVWRGTVQEIDVEGDRVRVPLAGPVPIVAEITTGALADLQLVQGDEVWASIKAGELSVYPA